MYVLLIILKDMGFFNCTVPSNPPKILYRLLMGGHWPAGTTLICIFYTLYTSCCILQLDGYHISSRTLAVSCSGSLLSGYTACVTACLLCICLQFMCILYLRSRELCAVTPEGICCTPYWIIIISTRFPVDFNPADWKALCLFTSSHSHALALQ